jgi:hypothetical protein
MKNIDEYYKEWCGQHHTVNSGHPVHDSAEACDFAKYYASKLKNNNIGDFSVIHTLQFAEWIGFNYVRLNSFWVHRYADQGNSNNWKTTGELFAYWMDNCQQ